MSDPLKALELSLELRHRLELMQRLLGDRWPAVSAEWREILTKWMGARNEKLIPTALFLAKKLSAAGHDPTLLLATATEMAMEDGTK